MAAGHLRTRKRACHIRLGRAIVAEGG